MAAASDRFVRKPYDKKEARNVQIIVSGGFLSEREQDAYVRHITRKCPASAIEKLYLEVHENHVDARYTLHRCRELRKMGGYCISEPATWNSAKQAEFRDMLPNRLEEES